MKLEVDPLIIVQSIDDHEIQVLLGKSIILDRIIIIFYPADNKWNQNLQAWVLLHDGQH